MNSRPKKLDRNFPRKASSSLPLSSVRDIVMTWTDTCFLCLVGDEEGCGLVKQLINDVVTTMLRSVSYFQFFTHAKTFLKSVWLFVIIHQSTLRMVWVEVEIKRPDSVGDQFWWSQVHQWFFQKKKVARLQGWKVQCFNHNQKGNRSFN